MKTIAVIPARLSSSRLHEKVLLDLGGLPLFVHVYNRAKKLKNIDDVIVATDSDKVVKVCETYGITSVLTSVDLQSGSDRVYEVVKDIQCDYVLNIQGDEPFFSLEGVEKMVENVIKNRYEVGTLGSRFTSIEDFNNPNNVKVVVDKNSIANYFSRSPIPYSRDSVIDLSKTIHHIGVYVYSKESLAFFVNCSSSILEQTEKLEQLRFLDAGKKIYLELGDYASIGIDTEDDYIKAKEIINILDEE